MFFRSQSRAADDSAWRNHTHDIAFHQALSLARLLELLSNRHLEALLYQSINVTLSTMDRHTTHRYRVILLLIPRGEGNVQRLGCHHSIILEQLVKIAHAKEEQCISSFVLQALILLHHRRGVGNRRSPRGRGYRDGCDVGHDHSVSHLWPCGTVTPAGVRALPVPELPYGGVEPLSLRVHSLEDVESRGAAGRQPVLQVIG